jgi:hypothetical protein
MRHTWSDPQWGAGRPQGRLSMGGGASTATGTRQADGGGTAADADDEAAGRKGGATASSEVEAGEWLLSLGDNGGVNNLLAPNDGCSSALSALPGGICCCSSWGGDIEPPPLLLWASLVNLKALERIDNKV